MATVTAPGFSSSNTSDEFDLLLFHRVNSHVRYERFDELLKLIDIDGERHEPVNLMNDPVLNVVISTNKTQLAVKLIEKVNSIRPLLDENICGDTALHIAAVKGNINVAKALLQREAQLMEAITAVERNDIVAETPLERESRLVKAVNKKGETAVHKAAMYGYWAMFVSLVDRGGTATTRKNDDSNMLHCAIMGNAPRLAFDIARSFPELILSRDKAGLTPLQLIVTNPAFLRSPLLRGSLNRFLYNPFKTVTAPSFSSSNISDEFDMSLFHKVNFYIRYERFDELLKLIEIDGERRTPVNLMNDPVLSVVISANKTVLAFKLICNVKSIRPLLDENIYGDTALHIAAVKGNFNVARVLLWRESVMAAREPQLVKAIAAIKGNINVAKALLQRESQLMEAIKAVEGNITVTEALLQTESQLVEAAREPQLVEAIAAVEGNITVVEALLRRESQLVVATREPQLVEAIAAIEENIIVAEALLQRESQLMEAAREPQLMKAIATVKRNITVAKALRERIAARESQLVKAVNKKGETAVHKAAMYGHSLMFWFLQVRGEMARYRTNDGSNMLHCAIMGNNPKLALDIARRFPKLILSRDEAGLTPLQLIITIPSFLRSPLVSGRLKSFLYGLLPVKVEDRVIQGTIARADEEAGRPVDRDRDEESYGCTWKSVGSQFHSQYSTIVSPMELIGSWVLSHVLKILQKVSQPVNDLAKEKERYVAAMKLVEYLAEKTRFDFYGKGYSREPNPTIFDAMGSHSDLQYTDRLPFKLVEYLAARTRFDFYGKGYSREPNPTIFDAMGSHDYVPDQLTPEKTTPNRWMEPPLIIAAELGLHDVVRRMLKVCPQSAIYLDSNGRNVMQVAIQSKHKKVVSVISEMLQGSNPILPSCLCSMLDSKSRNTILHLAAENSPPGEGDPLQLHHELVWFEMVKKIVPRELVYSRNREGQTAHELLTNRHEQMLERCKDQLVKIGSTCAGLVATVVLTSSFSFPSEKDNQSGSVAFKIVSHSYMIGFGCAATALLLFLLLVLRPYKVNDFRLAMPMLLYVAGLSFVLALGAFYLTVVCNIILQIYGSKINKKHLILLILELVLYPVVCFLVLLDRGVKISPSLFRI